MIPLGPFDLGFDPPDIQVALELASTGSRGARLPSLGRAHRRRMRRQRGTDMHKMDRVRWGEGFGGGSAENGALRRAGGGIEQREALGLGDVGTKSKINQKLSLGEARGGRCDARGVGLGPYGCRSRGHGGVWRRSQAQPRRRLVETLRRANPSSELAAEHE